MGFKVIFGTLKHWYCVLVGNGSMYSDFRFLLSLIIYVRGPLSLISTTEELLDRKVTDPV
jgi:hypothetical protein